MPPLRRVLALDTALNGCGVALFDAANNSCVQEQRAMPRGHSEELLPMILRVMQTADIAFAQIDLIAVTNGPGAFTGLRIGLAAAQGLGLALHRPVMGVTTLETITRSYLERQGLRGNRMLAVILDTKRADFYAQLFDAADHTTSAPLALSTFDLAAKLQKRAVVCVGDGAERFLQSAAVAEWQFAAGFERPEAEMVARIAADRYSQAAPDTEFTAPQPLYLRAPDVSAPKRALRTLAIDGAKESLRDA